MTNKINVLSIASTHLRKHWPAWWKQKNWTTKHGQIYPLTLFTVYSGESKYIAQSTRCLLSILFIEQKKKILFQVALVVRIHLLMQGMQVRSLDREDPLEKELLTHSTILAWKNPWTEEPGRLQSMGLQRIGYNWVTEHNSRAHYSLNKRKKHIV